MGLSLKERFALLPPAVREQYVMGQSEQMMREMARGEWWWTSRPEQIPPPGEWHICLVMSGRGWGKSRTASEWMVQRCLDFPADRSGFPTEWLVIAAKRDDALKINMNGPSGIRRVLDRRKIPYHVKLSPSPMIILTDTDVKIHFQGADKPDVGRGFNAAGATLDEVCVAKGEMVATAMGPMPIESVEVGMRVLTRNGWRRVARAGLTQRGAETFTIQTADGTVRVTGNHRVWCNSQWMRADLVKPGDIMATCLPKMAIPIPSPASHRRTTSGTARPGTTTSAPGTTTTVTACSSTEPYGPRSMGRSLTATRSTTSTATGGTTTSPTSNASPSPSIGGSLAWSEPTPGMSGAGSAPPECSPRTGRSVSRETSHASTAARSSSRPACVPSTAMRTVPPPPGASARPTVVLSVERDAQAADVYDLTVDGDAPEFFAGSGALLVHNCKWPYPTASWEEGIQLSLRADLPNDHPRVLVTTTPKPIPLLREWVEDSHTGSVIIIKGSIFDNSANLATHALRKLEKKYHGTRLGRQELYGELLDDIDGALFSFSHIENNRVQTTDGVVFTHTTVGVDPTLTDEGDLMGVVVVGRSADNHMYVIADESIPASGRTAADHIWRVFEKWGADTVAVEDNLGKKWMYDVLRDSFKDLKANDQYFEDIFDPDNVIAKIDSRKGKKIRAEPVSLRYELRTVHHVGAFSDLEEQMLRFDPTDSHNSPDRMDALVHACRHLMAGEARKVRVASPARRRMPRSSATF